MVTQANKAKMVPQDKQVLQERTVAKETPAHRVPVDCPVPKV